MHQFKKLMVWQKSREMTKTVYEVSKAFPKEEAFNLTSQIRRATTSVMLNIGEVSGRDSDLDFARFIAMASGSAHEVECAAIIAYDQDYLNDQQLNCIESQILEIKNMLFKFHQKLKSS